MPMNRPIRLVVIVFTFKSSSEKVAITNRMNPLWEKGICLNIYIHP